MTTKRNSAKVFLGLACLSLLMVCAACGSGSSGAGNPAVTVSDIQNQPNWTGCTGPGCAGGVGNATYSIIQGETAPSLDGISAEFQLGGSTGLSNVAWTKTFPALDSATQFTLDLQAYVICPCWPQALSFGISQIIGGQDYTFKYQCDFNGTGDWNLWDPSHQVWADTGIACSQLTASAWTHFVFQMERKDNSFTIWASRSTVSPTRWTSISVRVPGRRTPSWSTSMKMAIALKTRIRCGWTR